MSKKPAQSERAKARRRENRKARIKARRARRRRPVSRRRRRQVRVGRRMTAGGGTAPKKDKVKTPSDQAICSFTNVPIIRALPVFGNDKTADCAAAAVALSLLRAGTEATRQQAAQLRQRSGGGKRTGSVLTDVLAGLMDGGLAGRVPQAVRPLWSRETPEPGDVLEVTWDGGWHAVCAWDDGLWATWGCAYQPFGRVDAAWRITW